MTKSILLACVLLIIGDTITNFWRVPIPGAAIGLIMLSVLFFYKGGPDDGSVRVFDTVAPHFPMFFVPSAVGVIAAAESLFQVWFYVVVAIAAGTVVTIGVVGIVANTLINMVVEVKAS